MTPVGALGAAVVVAVAAALWLAEPERHPFEVRAFVRRLHSHREERVVARGLPALLEGVARGLRAGLSMPVALEDAVAGQDGPLRVDVERILAAARARGGSLAVALGEWADTRHDVGGVRLAVAAMTLAAESGGRIAQAVDGVADTLRGEAALADEVRALAAQAEASAVLIAVLPVTFALLAGATDPQTIRFLTTPPVGPICIGLGVSLDVGGFIWLRRIIGTIR